MHIKYIVPNQEDALWGLTVSSVGFQKVGAGEAYPPEGHQKEYMFNASSGRVLSEFQLLYIIEGRGTLSTESGGTSEVKAGDMFLLFPGEWHSYRPDEETGWSEYWIGFGGVNMEERVRQGFFRKEQPLFNIGYNELAVSMYEQGIAAATRQEPHFQQLLSGIVNHLLGMALTSSGNDENRTTEKALSIINSAKALMISHIEENLSMPDIAKKLNISYSKFRRTFKEIAGQSPSQYYIALKIQRAKEMLLSSHASIKEISLSLNFESPEYFATIFKKKTGKTPQSFRK